MLKDFQIKCFQNVFKCFQMFSCLSDIFCPSLEETIPDSSWVYDGQPATASSAARYATEATVQCRAGFEPSATVTGKPKRRVCDVSGNWVLDPDHQQDFVCHSE